MFALTKGNPDAPKDDLKVQVLDEIDRLLSQGDLGVVLNVLNTLGIGTEDLCAMLNLDMDACANVMFVLAMDTELVAPDAQTDAEFGRSVAIDGDTIAVGAPNDNDKRPYSGAVYTVSRNGAGVWGVLQKVDAPATVTVDTFDEFGSSVAISDDNLVIGAPNDEDDDGVRKGSVYIFNRNGVGAWNFRQRLLLSDGRDHDRFGQNVAISGDNLVVGAFLVDDGGIINAGAAYVSHFSGNTWGEPQELVADDKESYDYFGNSVAIDGDTIVVGSRYHNVDGVADAGSAYVFHSSGGSWETEQKLVASDGQASDFFGYSVAISGDKLVVGAHGVDDDGINNVGAAYVFHLLEDTWVESQKILAPDAAAYDHFGYSVTIEDDTIVVGSIGDDNLKGSAYIFKLMGGTWEFVQKLVALDRAIGDWFGNSVAISGDNVVAGATPSLGHDFSGTAWATTI
jgi:hypothetical protein